MTKRLQRVCIVPLPGHADGQEIGGEGGIRTHGADNRTTAFNSLINGKYREICQFLA